MSVIISAPGKLMLLGEHAVVYGYPCLVTAVDKRLYVEAELIPGDRDDIITPQVKESRFVLESIAHFKEKFNITSAVRIKTKGDFSHQVGLGSSSAVTVATFKALSYLFEKNLSLRQIFHMSYHVTIRIQGVGSGFDIASAVFGGTLEYVKPGKVIDPLFLTSLPLVVGYSGIKADTPYYIRKVAEDFKSKKPLMEKIFLSITNLVHQAKQSLIDGNMKEVGNCLTANHMFLQQLGVSTPLLDRMVESSIASGAWGAKLSGAGGGDCMIALVKPDKRVAVEEAIRKTGGEIIDVNVNTKGLVRENKI